MEENKYPIKSIEVKNYKSLKDIRINIRPFTIIIGENGTGKSSILECLKIYNQSNLIESYNISNSHRESNHLISIIIEFNNISNIVTAPKSRNGNYDFKVLAKIPKIMISFSQNNTISFIQPGESITFELTNKEGKQSSYSQSKESWNKNFFPFEVSNTNIQLEDNFGNLNEAIVPIISQSLVQLSSNFQKDLNVKLSSHGQSSNRLFVISVDININPDNSQQDIYSLYFKRPNFNFVYYNPFRTIAQRDPQIT